MRTWYKYLLNEPENGPTALKDRTPDEHRRTMGGFGTEEGYGSKEEFFKTYYINGPYHYHCKDEFSREHLPQDQEGLSRLQIGALLERVVAGAVGGRHAGRLGEGQALGFAVQALGRQDRLLDERSGAGTAEHGIADFELGHAGAERRDRS